jgi:hypothetical protein
MVYIGFDLDETLGRFSTPDGHLYFLQPDALYSTQFRARGPFHKPSEELQGKLKAAFQTFAECLASKEPQLGMLRPGILDIVGKLANLKEEGRVKAIVVYSNNGNRLALQLATTMIEHLLKKPGLFCNRVDWWSPIRDGHNMRGRPGQANKSARVLRQAFVTPQCADIVSFNDVPLENLYFFDDIHPVHKNIHDAIGEERYFKVNPYKRDADIGPIQDCFDAALASQNLDTNPEYLTYVNPMFQSLIPVLPKEFASVKKYLDAYNYGFVPRKEPFEDDKDAILAKIDALFPPAAAAEAAVEGNVAAPAAEVVNYGANYFPVVDGGRRRRLRRRTLVKKMTKKAKKHTRKDRKHRKN